MPKKKEPTKNSEEFLDAVQKLVQACVAISYHDHIKIHLATHGEGMDPQEGRDRMAESIIEVRRNLELRASLKNRLDELLIDVIRTDGGASSRRRSKR